MLGELPKALVEPLRAPANTPGPCIRLAADRRLCRHRGGQRAWAERRSGSSYGCGPQSEFGSFSCALGELSGSI